MAVRITRTGVVLTVGIIVVTGLLIGGLLWVQERGEVARREEAIKIAEQQLESDSNTDVATGDSSKNDSKNESKDDSSTQSGENSGKSTSELPKTGAGDIAPLLIIGVLTFFVAQYIASKKARA